MTEKSESFGVDQERSTARTGTRASRRIRAFQLGMRDGFRSPHDLTFGLTWDDDQDCNEAYDRGANLGQFLGALIR